MKKSILLLFTIFISFQNSRAQDNSIYMKAALNAERWLSSQRMVMRDSSIVWPQFKDSTSYNFSLYNGTPGVVLFYLELYHATCDRSYLLTAEKAIPPILNFCKTDTAYYSPGLYTGTAGAAYVLYEVYEVSGDTIYLHQSRLLYDSLCHRNYLTMAYKDSIPRDIMYGYAGVGCAMLFAYEHHIVADALVEAKNMGDLLLATSMKSDSGLNWNGEINYPYIYPNFSHGTAGISYFLASLYLQTHEKKYLDAAIEGANYLATITNDSGWIYHRTPEGKNRYYLGWCHGPAGTARLYYQLYTITGDKKWLNKITLAASSEMKCGIPDKFTPGFWNNVSMCCGNASVAEFFLYLNQHFHNAEYLSFSQHVLGNIIQRATADGDKMYWLQAENRTSPQDIFAQTGYMQGAAGIGVAMLQMDAVIHHKPYAIKLPDNPF